MWTHSLMLVLLLFLEHLQNPPILLVHTSPMWSKHVPWCVKKKKRGEYAELNENASGSIYC